MKRSLIWSMLFFGVQALLTAGHAGVPYLVNFQGRLTDLGGNPVEGSHNLTFTVYDDSAQSAQSLWTEQHVSVDVDAGIFNVLLGSVTGIPDSLFDNGDRWMGVTVDTDAEMRPRTRITSVPWALRAACSDSTKEVDWLNILNMPPGFADGIDDVGSGGGEITGVWGGLGLTGGGSSGEITLDVLAVPGGGIRLDPVDGVAIDFEGVKTENLSDSAVTSDKLAASAVASANLKNNAVTADKLDSGAVTEAKLGDNAVSSRTLGAAAVTNDKLSLNAVASDNMFDKAVTTSKLDTNAVTSGKIQDGTIDFDDIGQNGAADGQVMKWDGTAGAWTAANDSIGGAGAITGVFGGTGLTGGGSSGDVTLAVDFGGPGTDSTVSRSDHDHDGEYVNEGQVGSITGAMILDGGLHTIDFADSAVTTAKLDSSAVTSEKIKDGTIQFEDFGQNGAADGQVIKWNNAAGAWVAANDSVGAGGGGSGGWVDDGGVVRLEAAGDSVGIGTATPSAKLEVAGGIRTRGSAVFGPGHLVSADSVFVAGSANTVDGDNSSVCGGRNNQVTDIFSFIGGGRNNRAQGEYSVVAGGGGNPPDQNTAHGDYSVVGGGSSNTAGDTGAPPLDSEFATVSGGFDNDALSRGATVAGGAENTAGEPGGPPSEGEFATVGGGRNNRAQGSYSVVSGGGGEYPGDENHAQGDYASVGGGRRNSAGTEPDGDHATVGGGESNMAAGRHTTVGGGQNNQALEQGAAVGGGQNNEASGSNACVGGGQDNVARGILSTVPGGLDNAATGAYSFAAGRFSKASGTASVVISANQSSNPADSVSAGGSGQMVLMASSGLYVTADAGQAPTRPSRLIDTSTDAYLSTGGQWVDASAKNLQENSTDVDGGELLEKLVGLPVTEWNYKVDGSGVKHIGPAAQDVYATYGVGYDDKGVSAYDLAGISLAALKELYQQNKAQEIKIQELTARVGELESLARALLDKLEASSGSTED